MLRFNVVPNIRPWHADVLSNCSFSRLRDSLVDDLDFASASRDLCLKIIEFLLQKLIAILLIIENEEIIILDLERCVILTKGTSRTIITFLLTGTVNYTHTYSHLFTLAIIEK